MEETSRGIWVWEEVAREGRLRGVGPLVRRLCHARMAGMMCMPAGLPTLSRAGLGWLAARFCKGFGGEAGFEADFSMSHVLQNPEKPTQPAPQTTLPLPHLALESNLPFEKTWASHRFR